MNALFAKGFLILKRLCMHRCARCCRVFDSIQARNSHLQDSHTHHICPKCPGTQDFESSLALQNHLEESHYFCPDCKLYHNSFEKLQEHDVAHHRLCITCDDYFANKNNLQMPSPLCRVQVVLASGHHV
ncbi:hypothetical protein BJX68DRAFT_42671 [Aspergillus pseudodeflectus]|uniref:C2H2-type domain-containing protein n=1 Tax=Aspergillus pseudodeflectus TaxID=176178 RepID=A0ABR4J7W4_9EURO